MYEWWVDHWMSPRDAVLTTEQFYENTTIFWKGEADLEFILSLFFFSWDLKFVSWWVGRRAGGWVWLWWWMLMRAEIELRD